MATAGHPLCTGFGPWTVLQQAAAAACYSPPRASPASHKRSREGLAMQGHKGKYLRITMKSWLYFDEFVGIVDNQRLYACRHGPITCCSLTTWPSHPSRGEHHAVCLASDANQAAAEPRADDQAIRNVTAVEERRRVVPLVTAP